VVGWNATFTDVYGEKKKAMMEATLTEATLLIGEDDSMLAAPLEETILALGWSSLRPRGHRGGCHYQGFPGRNHCGRRIPRAPACIPLNLQESSPHAC
ncbi:MAG: hypothetical protein JZU65_12510, partial [Chlorobium sp.]|nr:hypothetical protein [Chlorobium sp.]